MADAQTIEQVSNPAAGLGTHGPAAPVATRRGPKSMWTRETAPKSLGRKKGVPNKVTGTIREAIEKACAPGACHPEGLAGWLIERAQGNVQDRQIFAGLVAKVLPAQLQASVQHQGVVVQLGWLQGRAVGRNGTSTAQSDIIDAQVLDAPTEKHEDLRVTHTTSAPEGGGGEGGDASAATHPDPHPPQNPAAGGSGE